MVTPAQNSYYYHNVPSTPEDQLCLTRCSQALTPETNQTVSSNISKTSNHVRVIALTMLAAVGIAMARSQMRDTSDSAKSPLNVPPQVSSKDHSYFESAPKNLDARRMEQELVPNFSYDYHPLTQEERVLLEETPIPLPLSGYDSWGWPK